MTYNYWFIVLRLLKLGISWDTVLEFSEAEVNTILGVQAALDEHQNEQSARESAKGNINPSMMGL
jgi:hypothetical protein